MDIVRFVLMQVEDDDQAPKDLSNYTEEQILYHSGLVIKAGLVDGEVINGEQGNIRDVVMLSLTWAGHDFLDAARSDDIWKKTKDKIISIGGAWTIDLLKALLLQEVKTRLGISP